MYAGCVSGASEESDYVKMIEDSGFLNLSIHKKRLINVPENILLKYITAEELNELKFKHSGIYSITISGFKS